MNRYTRPTVPPDVQAEIDAQAAQIHGLIGKWKLLPLMIDYRRKAKTASQLRQRRGFDRLGLDPDFVETSNSISACIKTKDSVTAARLLLTEAARFYYEIQQHLNAMNATES